MPRIAPDPVKKAAQRFRERFGVLLRQHLAETVADASDVDDEVRELLRVLGN